MKNIIITGGNGFLGRYIKAKLIKENFNVHNIGRSENSSIDLTTQSPILENTLFEKVIHIAGKAHSFPKTQGEEEAFYQVNLKGTKNLLKALNSLSIPPKSFIFISSVAVYGLIQGELVSEDAPTNANTPYGISKLKAEELIIKWCIKRKVKYQILRLPLIVGTNPPGNLGDMKRGIEKGFYFRINNNMAKKSVVLADDIAGFTAQEHNISGLTNLFKLANNESIIVFPTKNILPLSCPSFCKFSPACWVVVKK